MFKIFAGWEDNKAAFLVLLQTGLSFPNRTLHLLFQVFSMLYLLSW